MSGLTAASTIPTPARATPSPIRAGTPLIAFISSSLLVDILPKLL